MYFNKKQIKMLKAAEPYFATAVRSQYKRATTHTMNNMVADLYESVSGKNVSRNWSCTHCVFTLYEQAGRLYFESLKQVQEKNEPALIDNKLGEIDTDKDETQE